MNNVNKTLYIPLHGKAYVSRKGIILRDPKAEEIWAAEGFPLRGKARPARKAERAGIHQIAAAVAGGQQLLAHAIHPLGKGHPGAAPGSLDGRRHARRAAAYDQHMHVHPSVRANALFILSIIALN